MFLTSYLLENELYQKLPSSSIKNLQMNENDLKFIY